MCYWRIIDFSHLAVVHRAAHERVVRRERPPAVDEPPRRQRELQVREPLPFADAAAGEVHGDGADHH